MYEDAIINYNKGIILEPIALNYYKRGVAKKQLRRYQEALLDYSLAIEKDPLDGFYYLKRGQLKLEIPSREHNQAVFKDLDLHQEYAQYKKEKTFDEGVDKVLGLCYNLAR